MREPHQWIEDDIIDLVNERAEESLTLEFKSCGALLNKKWREELAKDVSAFANSAGGVLIYGIKENAVTHQAEQIDEGYEPANLTKETLQRVIDSRIHRRIQGIRYNIIELTKTRPTRVLFVIEIPESSLAPHMADHRFFKRFEFESKPMEEYEIRERYRRETFPGKDVVEAWRDDAINPLVEDLENEQLTLIDERWTWNHYYGAFSGLKEIRKQRSFSANAEDFIIRHKEVSDSLDEHDEVLTAVNQRGKTLFEKVAGGGLIRDVFAWATSDESLEKLQAQNANTFKGTTAKEIYKEIFSRDHVEQSRFDHFAEWAINGVSPTNIDEMLVFWGAYGDRFRALVIHPPLNEFRRAAERAREDLAEINHRLLTNLKQIRKELSERHNIAQAGRASTGDSYDGLSARRRIY